MPFLTTLVCRGPERTQISDAPEFHVCPGDTRHIASSQSGHIFIMHHDVYIYIFFFFLYITGVSKTKFKDHFLSIKN